MEPPIEYLDVMAGLSDRERIRLGLSRLKERQMLDWIERKGWWRSVFTTWGSPAVMMALKRLLGPIAGQPTPLRSRYLDTTI